MLIGKIVGTVVSARKDPKIEGLKLLVVRQLDIQGREGSSYVVAVDSVGAGIGEVVLYATGSSARQTAVTDKRPVDAVVMAIVDTWEIGGEVRYDKYRSDSGVTG
jgi:microcompartment protein CcmK/EutM